MSLHVFDRLAYISRIIDGLPPWNTLTFNEIYDAWQRAEFFDNIKHRGQLQIQYPDSEYIIFDIANHNRHVALALSTYIASAYHANDIPVVIKSPHESRGEFIATFNRLPSGIFTYKREDGTIVKLKFDASKPSQFVYTKNNGEVTNWDSFIDKLAIVRQQNTYSR